MKQKTPIYVLHNIKTCILGSLSRHISAAHDPIRLKFGLWLGLSILIGPYEAKKTDICTAYYQNLHPGELKSSYLSQISADSAEIWFVASPHDYIGTLYS